MQAITELWKHRQNLEDTLTADLTRLMVYPPDFNLPRLSSAALGNTQTFRDFFHVQKKCLSLQDQALRIEIQVLRHT